MDISNESNVYYSCPSCGSKGMFELKNCYESDRNLKEQVLNGSHFKLICPECGELLHPSFNFCYTDRERKFTIIYSSHECRDLIIFYKWALNVEDLDKISNNKVKIFRIVDSHRALKEKILIFEEGLNDKAIELVKMIMKQNEQYTVLPESELRFEKFVPNEFDISKGNLIFSHYINNQRQKDMVLFDKDKYDVLLRIIRKMERFRH